MVHALKYCSVVVVECRLLVETEGIRKFLANKKTLDQVATVRHAELKIRSLYINPKVQPFKLRILYHIKFSMHINFFLQKKLMSRIKEINSAKAK